VLEKAAEPAEQTWNWHVQNTDIVQYHPSFPAQYSGPNSLDSGSEVAETVSLDLYGGVRLWRGAEAHVDVLMWQGFGLSKTLGIEGFPSGEAYRLGTQVPNVVCARLFIRQTIGLGGEPEAVEDDQTHLAGVQDSSRLTITVGKMSAKDIFDNNELGPGRQRSLGLSGRQSRLHDRPRR
jgi:high affinity Mn2+ porin